MLVEFSKAPRKTQTNVYIIRFSYFEKSLGVVLYALYVSRKINVTLYFNFWTVIQWW